MSTPFPIVDVSPRSPDGLQTLTAHSPALGRRVDMTVWIPPIASRPLPLVTLLHGVYGSHWGWTLNGRAHDRAAELIADGEIPPVALAMPSDGLWGHGSGYVRHDDADYEAWIVDEVPDAVRRADVDIADAPGAIIGLSMGGFGALRLGVRHPHRYAAAAGLSSICRWASLGLFVGGLDGYPTPDDPDLGDLICEAEILPALRLDCGEADLLIAENRDLHARLTAAEITHDYVEHPGEHSWDYWSAHIAASLRFVGTQFETPTPPPHQEPGDDMSPQLS